MAADFARHRMQLTALGQLATRTDTWVYPWPGMATDVVRQVLAPWYLRIKTWLLELFSTWQQEWPDQKMVLTLPHFVAGVRYTGSIDIFAAAQTTFPEV